MASPDKKVTFHLFRYQIVPKSQHNMTLFDKVYTPEQLKELKNGIFAEIISNKGVFVNVSKRQLYHKYLYLLGTEYVAFMLGPKKLITLTDENFNVKYEQNHPNVYVVIDNRPDVQKIAISYNEEAFSKPQVVANVLELNLNAALDRYSLQVSINPILDKKDFWALIKQYENKITTLRFEIIKPNMTNISNSLADGMKGLITGTNSFKTNVELNAPQNRVLENINETNPELAGIANYSLNGGSTAVSMKIKGFRSYVKTDGAQRKTSVDEAEFTGTPEAVSATILKILGNDESK